jgi:alpha-glucosidase
MADVPIAPERAVDPGMARDPARTPMRWDAGPHAGFSTAAPWLPVGDGAGVAAQRDDARSMLTLYRRLLALRRASDDLAEGAYRTLHAAGGVLAYARGERTAVALNLTGEPRPLPVAGEIELSTHSGGGGRGLRPHEGVVLRAPGHAA